MRGTVWHTAVTDTRTPRRIWQGTMINYLSAIMTMEWGILSKIYHNNHQQQLLINLLTLYYNVTEQHEQFLNWSQTTLGTTQWRFIPKTCVSDAIKISHLSSHLLILCLAFVLQFVLLNSFTKTSYAKTKKKLPKIARKMEPVITLGCHGNGWYHNFVHLTRRLFIAAEYINIWSNRLKY